MNIGYQVTLSPAETVAAGVFPNIAQPFSILGQRAFHIHHSAKLGARVTRRKPTLTGIGGLRKIDALVCRKCSDADIANPKTLKAGEQVAMLPWAAEVVKNRLSKQDPEANCLPAGIPRGSPYPWRIVQTPTHYFILYEGNIHSYRQIFMNAKHPDDPDPTWYGHSVGHWEGNTLVVDTVGFNDKFWFDYKGHPHTEKLHTIERYTRTDLGHMAIEVTIDDPGAYAKPFTTAGKATLMPGTKLLEYICQENNQDLPLLTGRRGSGGAVGGWLRYLLRIAY